MTESFVWSPGKVSRLAVMDDKGLSPKAIAAQLGAPSPRVITKMLRAMGRVCPPAPVMARRVEERLAADPAPTSVAAPEIVVKPRPVSDWSEGGGEARAVFALRARKVPWAHIARQLGRNELTLRKLYDQEFDNRIVTAPPPPPCVASKAAESRRLFNEVLARVSRNTSEEIAKHLGVAPVEVGAILRRARLNGLAEHDFGFPRRWTLTDAGRAKIRPIEAVA